MTEYDNTNTWVLFANDRRREGKNDPTHNGSANVDGKEFWLNAWVKEKDGRKFFSGSLKPKEQKAATVSRVPVQDDMDDEIPF